MTHSNQKPESETSLSVFPFTVLYCLWHQRNNDVKWQRVKWKITILKLVRRISDTWALILIFIRYC